LVIFCFMICLGCFSIYLCYFFIVYSLLCYCIFMGLIVGTSTPVIDSSSTALSLESQDLSYTVILLIVIAAILFLDLVRRLFIKK